MKIIFEKGLALNPKKHGGGYIASLFGFSALEHEPFNLLEQNLVTFRVL